jgi:hypothetical protein
MKLEISSFANPGDLSRERIVLRVSGDIDVGDYAVFSSGVTRAGEPTSGRKAAYWFPDGEVKAGDLVVLYTKKGTSSAKSLDKGQRTAHFFYWGKETALWGNSEHCAVVLLIDEWESAVPPLVTPGAPGRPQ